MLDRKADQGGHDEDGEDRAGDQRKGQGQRHGPENTPFDTLHGIDGDEGGQQDGLGEQNGPAHLPHGLHNGDGQGRLGLALFVEDANQVLGNDHCGIHDDAEVNGAHRNQVGGNAAQIQQQVGAQQRNRHCQRHHQGGAVVAQPEEQHQHQHHQADAFDHVLAHRVQGAVNQLGAIVMRHQPDARRAGSGR